MKRRLLRVALGLLAALVLLAALLLFLGPNRIPREANSALDHSRTFTLFSLDPQINRTRRGAGEEPKEPSLYGYAVLGQTEITSQQTRRQLISTLRKGVIRSSATLVVPRCFNPRHAVRVTGDNKNFDFVICFECSQMQIFSPGATNHVLMSGDQSVFDLPLSQAGVPLPTAPSR